jgi:hypothetical protein
MREMRPERSIGDLFAELAKETSTLVRQEVALAKTELTQKASRAGRNVGYLVLGGAVAYGAFLAFAAAAILALAQVMPWWAAAVVVGFVIAGVAAVLVSKALNALKEMDPAPRQTVETLKEDVRWAKDQIK